MPKEVVQADSTAADETNFDVPREMQRSERISSEIHSMRQYNAAVTENNFCPVSVNKYVGNNIIEE